MRAFVARTGLAISLFALCVFAAEDEDISVCEQNVYENCVAHDSCIWVSSTHSCLHYKFASAHTFDTTKISHLRNSVGVVWDSFNSSDVVVGATYNGYVVQFTRSSKAMRLIGGPDTHNATAGGHMGMNVINESNPSVAAPIPPSGKWDFTCQNGGMKRWEITTKQNYDSVAGQLWGNTECSCLYGSAGHTCGGCASDDFCALLNAVKGIPGTVNSKCDTSVDFSDEDRTTKMTCYPVHNGAVAAGSTFGNDTVINLLNDYIEGLNRLVFDVSEAKGLVGAMLKPVENVGYRQGLGSAYLFSMESGSSCTRSSSPCADYTNRAVSGLTAMGLHSRWNEGATCSSWECSNLNVTCAESHGWGRWGNICSDFLKPLFAGSVRLVCNDKPMSTLSMVSNDFSDTPFTCGLWVYNDDVAFQMDCNNEGVCTDNSNATTPAPAPGPPPGWQTAHHGYCNKHKSWCYKLVYALTFGGPAVTAFAVAVMLSRCRTGFVPHDARESACLCRCMSPWRSSSADPRRMDRDSIRDETDKSRGRASTEDIESQDSSTLKADLLIPFLVSSESVDEKDGASKTDDGGDKASRSPKRGETFLHARNISFSLSPKLVKIGGAGTGKREKIIRDVSLVAEAGQCTAILGPSGSGKTSLLDIIAGRKTLGSIGGRVYLNGRPLSMEERRSKIGYVTQEDVLQPSATVREVLSFHAAMRMPRDATDLDRYYAVEDVLKILRLKKSANTRIGSALHKGISGGEKRRVSIGAHLVASCRAFALDEPLSGLDSTCAMDVLNVLENLVADRSKVVLMTIHQPSNRLFHKFQNVVLMAPHGDVVYAGPRSDIMRHFETIGLPPLPSGYSPAEYLLDLVSPCVEEVDGSEKDAAANSFRLHRRELRLADLFSKSDIARSSATKMKELEDSWQSGPKYGDASTAVTDSEANESNDGYARLGDDVIDNEDPSLRVGFCLQFVILLQRAVQRSLRNPALASANVGLAVAMAGLCALLYESMVMDLDGLISRAGLFFFSLSFFMLSTLVAFGLWQEEKLLFLHERASGTYSPTAYWFARTITDVVLLQLLPICCFCLVMYYPANLRWHPVALIYFGSTLLVSKTCSTALMTCIAMLFERPATAQLVGSMCAMLSMLMAGMLLTPGTLGSMKWLIRLSPLSYAFNCLMINEFGGGTLFTIKPRGTTIKALFTGDQMLDQFYIDGNAFGDNILQLSAITVDLHQIILARGPITVAEFMKQALLHPHHGYYTTKTVFGRSGDFTTAPEISQLFGEMLAIWCLMTWQQMGAPEGTQIVEIGPGRGTLMADMIRTFDKFPAFGESSTCHLVEKSESLREQQKSKLSPLRERLSSSMAHRATWHSTFDEVPSGAPTILIAQELLDALPVHQFEYTEKGWRERLVDIDLDRTDGRDFRFVLAPGPTPATSMLLPSSRASGENVSISSSSSSSSSSEFQSAGDMTFSMGDTIEVNPASCALVQDIAKRVQTDTGAALFIDYGNDFASASSLRGIEEHEFCDPLHRPGEVDLTADVDFASLRRAVESAKDCDGVHFMGPVTQGELLQRLGIIERFEMLAKSSKPEEVSELHEQLKRLVDPKEMGRIYKCAAVASEGLTEIVGFAPVAGVAQ
eukprot:g1818.t1